MSSMQPSYPVSSAPHIHGGSSSVLNHVILGISLLPAIFFGGIVFGFSSCAKAAGLGLMAFGLEWIFTKGIRRPFVWRDGQAVFAILTFIVLMPWPISFQAGAAGACVLAGLRVMSRGGAWIPVQSAAAALLVSMESAGLREGSTAAVLPDWLAWGLSGEFAAPGFGVMGWWPLIPIFLAVFQTRRVRPDVPLFFIFSAMAGLRASGVAVISDTLPSLVYVSLLIFSDPQILPLTQLGRLLSAAISGCASGLLGGGTPGGFLAGALLGGFFSAWIDHWIRSNRPLLPNKLKAV